MPARAPEGCMQPAGGINHCGGRPSSVHTSSALHHLDVRGYALCALVSETSQVHILPQLPLHDLMVCQ